MNKALSPGLAIAVSGWKADINKWLSLGFAIAVLVLVGFIWQPPAKALTPQGQMTLAIGGFAIIVWFTQALSDALSGIVIIFLLAGLNAVKLPEALSGYSNNALWLIVIGFIMAGAMEKTGLARRIALYILQAAGSRSTRVYWGVFLVMLILTFLVPSITARALLMLPILLGIGQAFGAKPDSRIMRGLLFIVAMSGTALSIGVLTAHVGNPTTAALIQKATGQEVSWAGWLKAGFPPALLLGVLSVLLISYLWKPEVKDIGVGTAFVNQELSNMGLMSRSEKYVLIVFVATVLAWATDQFHGVPTTVVGLMTITMLMFPRIGALDWKQAQQLVPWNVFVLYGAGLSLGTALGSTGAARFLAEVGLAPMKIFPVDLQAVGLIWLFTALQVFFTGGGPKTTALTPVVIAHASAIGVNPMLLALPLGMNMQHQYILPVTNMPNAVIAGTEYISQREMIKTGALMSVLACLVFTVVVFTYWHWIGLI